VLTGQGASPMIGPAAVTTGVGPIQQEGHESEDMEILQAMDKHLDRFFEH